MVKVLDGIWMVAGEKLTHRWDANAYLIPGPEPTLIDCGGALGYPALKTQLARHGYAPRDIRRILVTHGHWDHLSAAALLQAESEAELLIHPAERDAVERGDPDRTASFLYGETFPPVRVAGELHDGDLLSINGITLRVIHTPGHSPGGVCFLAETPGLRLLITGDTLWSHFHERVGSNLEEWQDSLERLLEYEFDAITTGHSPPLLFLDARERVREARAQLGVYFFPWFKPFDAEWRY